MVYERNTTGARSLVFPAHSGAGYATLPVAIEEIRKTGFEFSKGGQKFFVLAFPSLWVKRSWSPTPESGRKPTYRERPEADLGDAVCPACDAI